MTRFFAVALACSLVTVADSARAGDARADEPYTPAPADKVLPMLDSYAAIKRKLGR